ncbi:lycopene cyclase domain-containing protein [Aeromicrobium sp. IC_218]|uniref:lycopene cyclase domain-containing protein n=1 Tax=Aeromicrobium sp. IC_218 TaxID=2545468 RepID=UPI0010394957|nr:lycopene cyclase domain-containing protein [Aeromicrobium sp. IC_218]TCJ00135.1 lycopene cyclase domain-containing protein [Aeromicrobium sp. IC_218]
MTYATLALPFVGLAVVVLVVAAVVRRPGRRWWLATVLTLVALLVLTAVFDNVMIAADLFRYDDAITSGLRVGLAPLEDFAWPLAAGLGLPALALLARREDVAA